MKTTSKLLIALCVTLIGSKIVFAQEFIPLYPGPVSTSPPQLVGLPGVSVVRTENDGWTLKVPQGTAFIFTIDKMPALKLLLHPASPMTVNQISELGRLSLDQGEPMPAEFLIFPYMKGIEVRLYHCLTAFYNNRIFCNIVALPSLPLPLRQRTPILLNPDGTPSYRQY